ncbi:hypothetical protein MJN54_34175, partial [Salmonella enterica subsp. enterica serovar Kentucky]|nr:hypothetical protein [Salmonella enterica subsp. enterica serovar Kentucky]
QQQGVITRFPALFYPLGNWICLALMAAVLVIMVTTPGMAISVATVVQAQKAGKTLVVEAWDRTNSHKLSEGVLLSLDNQIDPTT